MSTKGPCFEYKYCLSELQENGKKKGSRVKDCNIFKSSRIRVNWLLVGDPDVNMDIMGGI